MDRAAQRRYLASLASGFALAAVLLPGYVETFPINVFHPEYAAWAGQIEFAGRPAQPEPEILVLGDSRAHAAIGWDAEGFFMQDLGSTNGTRVNGQRSPLARLKDGDDLQLGKLQLRITVRG